MSEKLKYILVLIFFLNAELFSANDSIRQKTPVLILTDSIFDLMENDESYLDHYYFYLADTSGSLKIEDVSSPEFQEKFLPVPYDSTGRIDDSLVVKSKVFWVRLAVKNISENIGEWWFNSQGGRKAELFVSNKNGFINKKTGFKFSLKERDVKFGEEYFLSLFISQDTVKTLFFRQEYMKDSRLALAGIGNKRKIIENDRRDRYIQGAFFGLLVIIALYNLLLYFFVKEISNIYYAFYLFCITISYLSTSGYGFELFWPDYPGNFIWIITIGWATAGFFYVLFGRAYLHTKEYLPKWNRILNIHLIGSVIAWFFILASVIYLIYYDMIGSNNVSVDSDSNVAAVFVAIGVIVTVIWIFLAFFIVLIPAFYCWKKNYQPAKYFLYASISLAIGIVVQIFGDSENIFTDNAFQFGVGLQAIFFSLGLGYRIDLLQKEKQKAQQDALLELEEKVQERTFEVVKQKEIVEDKQKEIIDSITYAKRLQEAILPPVQLIKTFLPDSFVLYKPKDIVAGDFYWMENLTLNPSSKEKDFAKRELGGEVIFIAAADCTGHGVPGAMVSVVCSNALNRAIKEFGLRDTGKILDKVTDLVLETFEKSSSEVKDGMDISLLCLEFQAQGSESALRATDLFPAKITWSGANNPLWYFQNGELKEIKADKQPIGKFYKRKPFTTHSIEAPLNTFGGGEASLTFYLFTDGFPDQFGGPKKKKFMYKRFEEKIIAMNSQPLEKQKEMLLKEFNDWKGNIEQVDDVTVLGIRI